MGEGLAQMKERWAKLPRERRLSIGISVAAGIGLLGALFVVSVGPRLAGSFSFDKRAGSSTGSSASLRGGGAAQGSAAAADAVDGAGRSRTLPGSGLRARDSLDMIPQEAPAPFGTASRSQARTSAHSQRAPANDASRGAGESSAGTPQSEGAPPDDAGVVDNAPPGAAPPGAAPRKAQQAGKGSQKYALAMPRLSSKLRSLKGMGSIRHLNAAGGARGAPLFARGYSAGPYAQGDARQYGNGSGGNMADTMHNYNGEYGGGKQGVKGSPFGSENADQRFEDPNMGRADGGACSTEGLIDPNTGEQTDNVGDTECGIESCMAADTERILKGKTGSPTGCKQVAVDAMRVAQAVMVGAGADAAWAKGQQNVLSNANPSAYNCPSVYTGCGCLKTSVEVMRNYVNNPIKTDLDADLSLLGSGDPTQGLSAIDLEYNFVNGPLSTLIANARNYYSCTRPCNPNPPYNCLDGLWNNFKTLMGQVVSIESGVASVLGADWCARTSPHKHDCSEPMMGDALRLSEDLSGHYQAIVEVGIGLREAGPKMGDPTGPVGADVNLAARYMGAVYQNMLANKGAGVLWAAKYAIEAYSSITTALNDWNTAKSDSCKDKPPPQL